MRIGNRDLIIQYRDNDGWHSDFESMSGGGCRNVYLHSPSNVVYKFPDYSDRGYTSGNEYRHARALRNQSDNGWIGRVYIPLTSAYRVPGYYEPIIAMEYVGGETPAVYSDTRAPGARKELFMLGFSDMHRGNYRIIGNKVGVIDLGSPRYVKNPRVHSDIRTLTGTSFYNSVSAHRDYYWQVKAKVRGLPTSCPCDCGMVP